MDAALLNDGVRLVHLLGQALGFGLALLAATVTPRDRGDCAISGAPVGRMKKRLRG